jgi:hypothetical protein
MTAEIWIVEEDKISSGKERCCKHVSVAAEAEVTKEEFLEAVHPNFIYWGVKWSCSQWLAVKIVRKGCSQTGGSQW